MSIQQFLVGWLVSMGGALVLLYLLALLAEHGHKIRDWFERRSR